MYTSHSHCGYSIPLESALTNRFVEIQLESAIQMWYPKTEDKFLYLLISLFEDHRDLVAKLSHNGLPSILYIVVSFPLDHYI